MANGAALIRESLWRDRDFRALPRTAQCLYLQLLSQKDLDCAGILTLNRDVLVKGCDEMTPTNLDHDFKALAETRFIVIDADSDEVLIRSYMRHVSVKSPNVWKAAKAAVGRVCSPEIRRMLVSELLRLGRADATHLANQITPDQNPSETVSEPFPNPIETGNPSGTLPEPSVPVPVPVPFSSHVGGWVGRAADAAPTCPKHPDGPNHDQPCRTCKQIREHTQTAQAAETLARREALKAFWDDVENCKACTPKGWIETDDGAQRCPNHDWEVVNGLRR